MSLRVLLADDQRLLRAGLRQILEDNGYQVETAGDGREALDRLAQGNPPAMILLDLMMPRMDGWQFLEEWRSVPDRPRIPIVLLSGVGAIPDAAGVADFLRKPVSPARLVACVERYCR